eukprot:gene20483-23267_t
MAATGKILKLRPVAKTAEELEEEKMLYFVLPRKTSAQMVPELLRMKNISSHDHQHRMHILKKLMKIARIKGIEEKMSHFDALDASEKVIPHGEVSKRMYNEIFKARDFDLYGNIMPPTTHPPRKHLELAVLAQKLNVEFTQKADQYYKEINSDDEESPDEDDRRKDKLRTEKWKIGYVPHHNPPVGLADNPARAFNSLGNEYFYSYDGEWKNGRMHGNGTYLFRDGKTYEGRFQNGHIEGEGTAYYPGGQKYVGEWQKGRYEGKGETFMLGGSKYVGDFEFGRRHGQGTLTYPSGLTYVGQFLDGKPHGRGVMTSALSGWSYDGSFELGSIRGSGTLYTPPPERKPIVYYWAENKESISLPALVRHYMRERDDEILQKEQARHIMLAPLRGQQLKNYVTGIRNQLNSEKLAEKKRAYNEAITKAKEQKARLYEARLKALAGEEDDS